MIRLKKIWAINPQGREEPHTKSVLHPGRPLSGLSSTPSILGLAEQWCFISHNHLSLLAVFFSWCLCSYQSLLLESVILPQY